MSAQAFSSLATMSSARADFSGSVRAHWASSTPRMACSTLRMRPSSSFIRSRGTLPAASQRSAMSRNASLAARRSVTGSSASASTRSASFFSALAVNSASSSALALSRLPKKVSCAPRNRCQSWSSTPFGAGPAAFQRRIRSRYFPAVAPHSVDSASASASTTSFSLTTRASSRFSLRSAKCAFRRRVYVVRAVENLRQRASSTDFSSRGSAFHSSSSCAHPVRPVAPVGALGEPLGLGGDPLLVDRGRPRACGPARPAAARAARRSPGSGRRAGRRAPARSPTAWASWRLACTCLTEAAASSGPSVPAPTRCSRSSTSKARSS